MVLMEAGDPAVTVLLTVLVGIVAWMYGHASPPRRSTVELRRNDDEEPPEDPRVVPEVLQLQVPGGEKVNIRADKVPIPDGEHQDDYLLWLREQSDLRASGIPGDPDYDNVVQSFI